MKLRCKWHPRGRYWYSAPISMRDTLRVWPRWVVDMWARWQGWK